MSNSPIRSTYNTSYGDPRTKDSTTIVMGSSKLDVDRKKFQISDQPKKVDYHNHQSSIERDYGHNQQSQYELNYSKHNAYQGKIYIFPFKNHWNWTDVKDKLIPVRDGKINDIKSFCAVLEKCVRSKHSNAYTNAASNVSKILQSYPKDKQKLYLEKVLPSIAHLALELPNLFPQDMQLLSRHTPYSITLTKKQCASLLCGMFFCVLNDNYNSHLPNKIDFSRWFSNEAKLENLKCLFSYFERMATLAPGVVTFTRLSYSQSKQGDLSYGKWKDCELPLSSVTMKYSGTIEETPHAAHVDFANKYLGGGVLGKGNVQEEILFTTHPECIVGLLFAEDMQDDEAILIKGADRYCRYSGYAQTFKYEGPVLSQGKDAETIIAINAIDFSKEHAQAQFEKQKIERELNKAFIGFFGDGMESQAIATGKWGCGAFGGDVQLKFVIQWLAASRARRRMIFCTGEDKALGKANEVLKKYEGKRIWEVMKAVDLYSAMVLKREVRSEIKLFDVML